MISIQVVVYVYYNTGIENHTQDCGGDNFGTPASGIVLKLFRLAKSKVHQDWIIVFWHNEADDWTQ